MTATRRNPGSLPRPFSIDPIIELLDARIPTYEESKVIRSRIINDVLNETRWQVRRWKQKGLDAYTADYLATRLGLHPVELWDNWFDLALASA